MLPSINISRRRIMVNYYQEFEIDLYYCIDDSEYYSWKNLIGKKKLSAKQILDLFSEYID